MPALGARPLPVPDADLPGVLKLRTLADAMRAHLAPPCRDVVVIGAGFVGMEVAATAREQGHRVTVVETAHRSMVRG